MPSSLPPTLRASDVSPNIFMPICSQKTYVPSRRLAMSRILRALIVLFYACRQALGASITPHRRRFSAHFRLLPDARLFSQLAAEAARCHHDADSATTRPVSMSRRRVRHIFAESFEPLSFMPPIQKAAFFRCFHLIFHILTPCRCRQLTLPPDAILVISPMPSDATPDAFAPPHARCL